MNSKRFLGFLLAAVLLLSLAACGAAPAASAPQATAAPQPTQAQTPAPAPAEITAQPAPASELSDIDAQLKLILTNMDKMQQPVGELPWYYSVTDLDHDGCLEFIAASQHPADRSTNLKVWEVSSDRTALTECTVEKDAEESFPDIMTDSADTFFVEANNSWNYLFYDNVVLSDMEVYTSKSSFCMKDGVISYTAYAVEHTVVENNVRQVSYTNASGEEIDQEEYNDSGVYAFAGAQRSSTGFEWLTNSEVRDINRLTGSYAVFMGVKKATENFPVPKPAAMNAPEATAAPATPTPTATRRRRASRARSSRASTPRSARRPSSGSGTTNDGSWIPWRGPPRRTSPRDRRTRPTV